MTHSSALIHICLSSSQTGRSSGQWQRGTHPSWLVSGFGSEQVRVVCDAQLVHTWSPSQRSARTVNHARLLQFGPSAQFCCSKFDFSICDLSPQFCSVHALVYFRNLDLGLRQLCSAGFCLLVTIIIFFILHLRFYCKYRNTVTTSCVESGLWSTNSWR